MGLPLSHRSIDALVNVISGGSANDSTVPLKIYRKGWEIEQFVESCGGSMTIDGDSRVGALRKYLLHLNSNPLLLGLLETIICRSVDPAEFIQRHEIQQECSTYLNQYLFYDDLEVRIEGRQVALRELTREHASLTQLSKLVGPLSFDTVERDLGRALEQTDVDPEAAITAACSMIESVCRSILAELEQPLPAKRDIQSLYKEVARHLNLSAGRDELPSDIAVAIKTTLGNLAGVSAGVGDLRTRIGNAHGRERGYARVDGRIARLCVHASSTVALFLLETWLRLYPERKLQHDPAIEVE